ncbi:hypothetical protein [Lunatimonas salinarum]|uniref:hypothetical protein n=1 Tax=Lunatimonas salinarum TaxID=1774590 RepID=UPI001FD7F48C|nr:hypothetical protein [Lunatimonas salinarum]
MGRSKGRVWWIQLGLVLLFVLPAPAQDEDIFGIERKLKNRTRKSDSELGNVFRNVLGGFSFEVGGGVGYHTNSMSFASMDPTTYPITSVITETVSDINQGDTLGFRGGNLGFPFQMGIKLNLVDLIEIGGGYGREWGNMDALRVEDFRFNFGSNTYTFDKLYGSVGLILYDAGKRQSFLNLKYRKYAGSNHYMQSERKLRMEQDYPWRFLVDAEFGQLFLRQAYDGRLNIDKPFYSIGFRIEREFSEYTKMFVRPSVTFREFTYIQGMEPTEVQQIKQQLFTVQLGVALRLPATKRCKVPGCGVVMKHLHNGVEYRGSSIWNMQHRKVGQW